MKFVSVCLCYPYQKEFGTAIYANVPFSATLEKLKTITDNFDQVDFTGVNNVSVMLENRDADHGRIFSAGGYSSGEGLFIREYP